MAILIKVVISGLQIREIFCVPPTGHKKLEGKNSILRPEILVRIKDYQFLTRRVDHRDHSVMAVGALLHDIGKMGVPDRILLKPGPLTDDEWVVMKKHTTFAYELLSPIHFLLPAIDIPYCHHEKWDGTGYPRGLIGEQIPLVARLFAVVDVRDALTSDRPYRKAWSQEKTIDHIESGSGTHFDPQVVKAFLLDINKR